MDLRQLRFFAEVAHQASFTKAAQALCVVQSAVSIAIKKLEDDLELTLFNRVDRKVTLTPEGAVLLRHAHQIIDQFQAARLEMDELKGLEKGVVRIGIPNMLGTYYFPKLLTAFKRAYPGLQLTVHEGGARQLQQMIHAGELDMGIIVSDELPAELESRVFLREEMVTAMSSEHPLAQQTSIDPATFFSQELVVMREAYFHREFVERMARQGDYTLNIAFETNLVPLIISIVEQGFGITTFLRMVVEESPGLVAVPFSEPVHLDLCIAWKRGSYLAKADRAFIDFLLDYHGEGSANF